VSRLQDVKSATIQIEAVGSFTHPQFGQILNAAGSGSGFIIAPSGIAVTNNHVVTGAALLKVWVGGEREPRNAKVLGVSECSDLAVIDIEGEGYPYLEWYDGDITAGLSIYVAGFPLGDPEYTLLQGIVSKERAGGETNWASVDRVIEHTALTNPGNSGGPVVTQDGKVVAVHYAGDPETIQHFAIARDEALPILEQLRAGKDVDSVGVNGEAVNNGEGLSGIWVASVKSGSPADKAGVKGGDIITKLEGLVLSTDGTMADYCDILRTHNPGDTLNIEVPRFATQEVLEGQFNGRELEQSFSFAQQVEVGETGEAITYSGYTTITDDSGAITMDVPVEWSDVSGNPWEFEGETVGAAIVAAGSRDDFYNTWSEPGVFFGASHVVAQSYNEDAILDRDLDGFSTECEYQGRSDYQDPLYTGRYDLYKNCGGLGTTFINLAAVPESRAFVIQVQVQIVSEADLEALDTILDTFKVIGDLPSQ
jgi:serine protease Do